LQDYTLVGENKKLIVVGVKPQRLTRKCASRKCHSPRNESGIEKELVAIDS